MAQRRSCSAQPWTTAYIRPPSLSSTYRSPAAFSPNDEIVASVSARSVFVAGDVEVPLTTQISPLQFSFDPRCATAFAPQAFTMAYSLPPARSVTYSSPAWFSPKEEMVMLESSSRTGVAGDVAVEEIDQISPVQKSP